MPSRAVLPGSNYSCFSSEDWIYPTSVSRVLGTASLSCCDYVRWRLVLPVRAQATTSPPVTSISTPCAARWMVRWLETRPNPKDCHAFRFVLVRTNSRSVAAQSYHPTSATLIQPGSLRCIARCVTAGAGRSPWPRALSDAMSAAPRNGAEVA